MDKSEYWLIYDPIEGYEEQINAVYAETLGEPDAFMVLDPASLNGTSLTMVDRWKYNRYPIFKAEENPADLGRELMARYLVLDTHRSWFQVCEGMTNAKLTIDGLVKLQEQGQLEPFNLSAPTPTPLLIKPEYEVTARSESFFF